ncbi:MAG: GNAT family N-acetyltransferase [Acetobacteraceae bacterium]|nr:GNAT family N-acetyltransferase [Acetobacteraceae bacterium]
MAPTLTIERLAEPGPEHRAAIDRVLDAYNNAASGRADAARWFGVLVDDARGAPTGGAICVSYWDWVFVDILHLPETMRGQGVGTRVMRAVEAEARRRGCIGVWLETGTYQAPGFYRKLGYREFARLPEMAPGVTRHSFLKTQLQDAPQHGVRILDDPPPTMRALVRDGLIAYNDGRAGATKRLLVAVVTRSDPGGAITGGLWGRISRNWMFVELLIVPEGARGRGHGSALLRRAEDAARAEGCRGVHLDTFSFQARPFYERHGYQVIGEIPDYPAPHRRYFLAKRLDGSPVLPEVAHTQAKGAA